MVTKKAAAPEKAAKTNITKTTNKTKKTADAAASASKTGDSSVRIIKKYPNRRLYDTTTSAYITMAEVKRLVMKTEPFRVLDVKTSDDLTRSILLQIILEEESGGAPMFTEAILANIIRFYGNAMQSFMGAYLEKNVQNFTDIQTKIAQRTKVMSPEELRQAVTAQNPLMQGMMGTAMEQMQKQTDAMLSAFGLKPK